MNYYPNQRVSSEEKQTPNWYKPTVDYLIKKAESQRDIASVIEALNAANGIASKSAFDYVIKPFQGGNSTEREITSPISIRDVDFITPIVERFMGEYLELPYKYMVTNNSDDAIIMRDAACAEAIANLVESHVIKYMEEMQKAVESGQEPPETIQNIDLEAYAENFKKNWIDQRAIKGQRTLDHAYKYNNFDYQRLQAYYYWLTTNEVYTYRYIENGELIREVISPLEAYPISNGSPFVEDYDGFVIKRRITFQQLLEQYLRDDMLTLEDIDYLESLKGRYTSSQPLRVPTTILRSRYGFGDKDSIPVADALEFADVNGELDMAICIFRSETKVNILRYTTGLGQVAEMPVESNYKLNPEAGDIDLSSTYISEVLVSYRFGDENTGIYTKPVPDPIQRYDSVTRSPKLPVGGKDGILNGIRKSPIGMRLIPFSIIDRILLNQIELTMAKYKGAILLMPQSLIKTDDTGTTKQKYFYMRSDGTLIYDDADVDFNTIAQGVRFVTDEVLGKYLETLIRLRDSNRADAYEVASMNQDRNAQADTRGNVSNVQQNIYRAKLGTSLLIQIFNHAFERDHISDLEYGKYAYVNGLADSYFDKDENKNVPYTFNTLDILDEKLGVYVSNSKVDEGKLQFLADSLSHAASQNQDFETAIEAATVDSIPLLKQRVKEIAEQKRTFEAEMADREAALEDKRQANRMAEIQANNDTKIRIALINKDFESTVALHDAISGIEKAATPQSENSTAKDLQAQIKLQLDKLKIELEERKQMHKERQDKEDNRLKEKKIDSDRYIAKVNKN